MSTEVINGARTSFGPRTTANDLASSVLTVGVKKQQIVPVKFDNLVTHVEDDVTGAYLPANALITNVYAVPASETFASGTSYDIDLVENDGTSITTVGTVALADMNSGAVVTVADATVGSTGPAYFEVTETGSFTAGAGAVVVEYIEQFDLVS